MLTRLEDYFSSAGGFGVLSTADGKGKVDAAINSRPHLVDDRTIAFITRDPSPHHNLKKTTMKHIFP